MLSIVIPAYNEAGGLRRLHEALSQVLGQIDEPAEIILVDDGSVDDTWAEICALSESDPRVVGIRFSRNFGHQYALLAGLSRARGSAVISMDADFQHPPELIPTLLEAWRNGAQIVHTVRIDSGREPWAKRVSSRLFYAVLKFLSGTNLEPGMADFRLLDRRVVDTLKELREEGLFLRGLVHWVGFQSVQIPFECGDRLVGTTKYTTRKMLRLAWNGVTSFSLVPLRIAIVIGCVTALLAFGELVFAIYAKVTTGTTVPGWASAVGVLSLLFGVLFVLLGVMGEYLGRTLIEVRGRPRYIVSDETRTASEDD